MAHRASFLPSFHDDDDDSPINSPTPYTSFLFLFDSSDSLIYDDDNHPHPHPLLSVDSVYFNMGKETAIPKAFTRKPSSADMRFPLTPVSGTTDANQVSLKREGVIHSLLRKKKKSMTSSSPPDLSLLTLGDSQRVSPDDLVPQLHHARSFTPPPPRSKPRDPSVDAFEELDRFVVRRGMKHHPYPRDDAPYMLAYDRTLLDNDRYSEMLLRRLNHNHSPSFLDFSHTAPRIVLDLGCGTGGWAVEAAEFWPSSQVIGFDLLGSLRLREGADAPSNVQWKQGNFVKHKLPFPKNMFDLVRMANLSLCIPYERWEHVLFEVRRVLAQGGHLEMIDDHLYFPYTKRPPWPPVDSRCIPHRQSSSLLFDSDIDDGAEENACTERRDGDDDADDEEDEDFVSTKSRFSTLVDTENGVFPLPPAIYDPVSEWNRYVDNSKCLEKLFEDMLPRKFSIHPWPNKFLDNVVDKVFGRYNQCRLHEFNLYLAPPSAQDSDGSSIGSSEGHTSASLKKVGRDFAKWVTTVEWDHHKEKKKNRSSDDNLPSLSTVLDPISAKAAGRPGMKPTPSVPSHSCPAQSPGLILWPATFIPVPPFELEMHACKHLHSVIGSKAALSEYLRDIALEQNLPFDQHMVDDLIWDYESFRRKRFNWPSDCPDLHHDTSLLSTTTPRSNTSRNPIETLSQACPRAGSGNMRPLSDPLFPREKLDFVRSIRVYSATKNDEEVHIS